jgi:hypothetical protein
MRLRTQIAAIFIAVGLGALVVVLVHEPRALIPQPPYGPWIVMRLLVLGGLATLGLLLTLGVVDDPFDIAEPDVGDPPFNWRVVGLAFLISVLACATVIATTALTEYLDRCCFTRR